MKFDFDNFNIELATKHMEDYFAKIETKREKVSSKEYIDWLYNCVSNNKQIDDESALYAYEGIDAENGKLLSYFLNYVEVLAAQQRVLVWCDEECSFDNEQVVVKIKDKYFDILRMHGQGSWTSVKLMDKKPTHAYVKLMY